MNGFGILFGSAFFCVFSRAALNVWDRFFLKKEEVNFLGAISLNALYPLFFAFLNLSIFGGIDALFFKWIAEPGVILSGLGAQLTAASISFSFRKMNVKSVALSNKASDLVVPFAGLLAAGQFAMGKYVLINLTTLALAPIILTVYKDKRFFPKFSLLIVGSLFFQAFVNEYYHVYTFAQSWRDFSRLILCILFWRVIFVSLTCLYRGGLQRKFSLSQITRFMNINCFFRGIIAFSSQAAFFLCITRKDYLLAWPILNAGPLLSCYLGAWFLKEKAGRPESQAVVLFIIVIGVYFILGDKLL